MMNLYFAEPQEALIKINNTIFSDNFTPIKNDSPLILEYISFSNKYDSFCTKIDIKNRIYGQNIQIVQFDEQNYLIEYQPDIRHFGYFLTDYNSYLDYTFYLVENRYFQLIIYKENIVKKVINLPKNLVNPKLNIYNNLFVISGSINNQKYLLIMDEDLQIIVNLTADKILHTSNEFKIINNYNDTLCRTKYRIFNYEKTLKLTNKYFEYKKSDSTNLPLLFIEAYIADDVLKMKEYLSFDVDYKILQEYLNEVTLVHCPYDNKALFFTNSNGNFKVAKTINCKISNGKIDTFSLV